MGGLSLSRWAGRRRPAPRSGDGPAGPGCGAPVQCVPAGYRAGPNRPGEYCADWPLPRCGPAGPGIPACSPGRSAPSVRFPGISNPHSSGKFLSAPARNTGWEPVSWGAAIGRRGAPGEWSGAPPTPLPRRADSAATGKGRTGNSAWPCPPGDRSGPGRRGIPRACGKSPDPRGPAWPLPATGSGPPDGGLRGLPDWRWRPAFPYPAWGNCEPDPRPLPAGWYGLNRETGGCRPRPGKSA